MYPCVAVCDYTRARVKWRVVGAHRWGSWGRPMSLPPGLQAALPSDGEITPACPPPRQSGSGWRGRASPHLTNPRPYLPASLCWPPGLLTNLNIVRGHRPPSTNSKCTFSFDTLVPTWGNRAPTLMFSLCMLQVCKEKSS